MFGQMGKNQRQCPQGKPWVRGEKVRSNYFYYLLPSTDILTMCMNYYFFLKKRLRLAEQPRAHPTLHRPCRGLEVNMPR